MRCNECGHENRDQVRFCENCGHLQVAASCTSCGEQLAPNARFCGECGTPVPVDKGLDTSVHLEAERRQLAVLFCDLVDSTALAQQVGDETLRLIINRYHKTANDIVGRYGGHIAQYLGDGLLIYFGYPRAHEDDSERAIRAARDLLEEIKFASDDFERDFGVRIQARIGIHTGQVVISELGGGGKRETLALGETANIAARLDHVADPGCVVISAATLKLVSGLFLTEPLGTRQLKGITDPVEVFRVVRTTGVRSRLDVNAQNLSPLIGRDRELSLMLERFNLARKEQGQVVLLSGEAGFGKSRLVKAFRDEITSQPHTWLECQCSDYTRNSPFLPIADLARRGLGFTEQTDLDQKLELLKAALARLDIPLEESLPIMARFLSLDYPVNDLRYSAELIREKTFDILVAWILSMSKVQKVIMHFEDAHWSDPSSIELMKRVILACRSSTLTLIITFRTGSRLEWPAEKHVTAIALDRLSEEQTQSLVMHTLERQLPQDAEPDQLARLEEISRRAEGNPLYAEELAKGLATELAPGQTTTVKSGQNDADQIIPSALQGALMSRLDRLGRAKELAQTCAVLGRSFNFALVGQISGLRGDILRTSLARLVEAEMLLQHGDGSDAIFSFKHILIQQIAYQSITTHQRKEMHADLARVLKQQFAKGDVEAEIIAQHFDAAQLPLEAISFYQLAATKLIENFANSEAISQLERALVLVKSLEPGTEANAREMTLLLQLGTCRTNSAGYADEQLPEIFGRARMLSEKAGSGASQAHALYGLGVYHTVRADLDEALSLAKKLIQHAEKTGEIDQKCAGSYRLAEPLFYMGKIPDALEYFELSNRYYNDLSRPFPVKDYAVDLGVLAPSYTAWCAWLAGKADLALEVNAKGLGIARQRRDPATLAHALMFAATLHSFLLRWVPVMEFGEECRNLSEETGIPFYHSLGGMFVSIGHARLSAAGMEPAEALGGHLADLEQRINEISAMGQQIGVTFIMCNLAEIYSLAGRNQEAMGVVEMALGLSEQTNQHWWDADLLRLKSVIALNMGGSVADSRELLEQGLKIARSQSAKSLELRLTLKLHEMMNENGEAAGSRALLKNIFEQFDQGFEAPDLITAKQILSTPSQ